MVLGGGIVGGPCCGGGGGMVKAGGGVAGWLSGCSFEHWQEEPWQVLQAGALWVVLGGGTVGRPCFGGGGTVKAGASHARPKAALVFWWKPGTWFGGTCTPGSCTAAVAAAELPHERSEGRGT